MQGAGPLKKVPRPHWRRLGGLEGTGWGRAQPYTRPAPVRTAQSHCRAFLWKEGLVGSGQVMCRTLHLLRLRRLEHRDPKVGKAGQLRHVRVDGTHLLQRPGAHVHDDGESGRRVLIRADRGGPGGRGERGPKGVARRVAQRGHGPPRLRVRTVRGGVGPPEAFPPPENGPRPLVRVVAGGDRRQRCGRGPCARADDRHAAQEGLEGGGGGVARALRRRQVRVTALQVAPETVAIRRVEGLHNHAAVGGGFAQAVAM